MKACKGEDMFTLKNANSMQAHGLCFKSKDAYICAKGLDGAMSILTSLQLLD